MDGLRPLMMGLALTTSLGAQETATTARFGRTYVAIGGGLMLGAYEVANDSADVRLWYSSHSTRVVSGIAELRHRASSGLEIGARVIRSSGFDKSTDPVRVFQSGLNPPRKFAPYDTAREDDFDGLSVMLSVDTRFLGVTGGVATGRWVYASDYPITDAAPSERTVPIGALRIGQLTGWHGEAGYGRHLPALAPRPVAQAGLARGNLDGTRLFRFGVGKEGLYVGGRSVSSFGLDIEPYFSVRSSAERQFSISIRQRVRLLR